MKNPPVDVISRELYIMFGRGTTSWDNLDAEIRGAYREAADRVLVSLNKTGWQVSSRG